MSNGPLPGEVERFLREQIDSVEELEVLLLLFSTPEKEWSAAEMSQHLYRQPDSIVARLEKLRTRGVLLVGESSPPRYRYNTATSLHEIVKNLERAYRERKDTVIRLIFETPRDNLKIFSDAFKIRRRD